MDKELNPAAKQCREKYRHPQHDAIVQLVQRGMNDVTVASTLGVGRRAVARVRDILGMDPARDTTTPEEKLSRGLLPVDELGHTGWSGRYTTSGVPMISHKLAEVSASHIVFRQRTGREPVGLVKADCGVRDCLSPGHLTDELDRRKLRMFERDLLGMAPQPWEVCPKGLHSWDEHGRLQPSLKPYCGPCGTARTMAARAARKASAK